MQISFLSKSLLPAALLAATLTSCGVDEHEHMPNTPTVEQKGTFVIPADIVASGNAASHVLLTTANLSSGTLSPRNNGLLFDGGFEYIFFQNKYLCTTPAPRVRTFCATVSSKSVTKVSKCAASPLTVRGMTN